MSSAANPQGQFQFGVAGMGVMGANIALNIADRGFKVAAWDRHPEKIDAVHAKYGHPEMKGTGSLAEFVQMLERPRRILLMVTAGAAVDSMMDQLAPLLSPGDVLIDGGNSWFHDTQSREKA